MKTKVKSVQQNGTYNRKSDNKLMYKCEYVFEDGQELDASHLTQDRFKEGDEIEYEVKGNNNYGDRGSVQTALLT